MTVIQKIIFSGAVLGEALGLLLVGVGVYYLTLYNIEGANPGRHEYMLGVFMAFAWATGFLLSGAAFACIVRSNLSRFVFRWLAWPSLAVGLGILVLYFGQMGWWLLNR